MSRLMERWKRGAAAYPTMASALFVSGEDFLRFALQAHLAARREMVPEAGQRWLSEGPDVSGPLPWASAEAFAEALTRHLAERLRRHAIATGHLSEVPWPDSDDEPAGAGRSPAVKGHGCPASAVGGLPPAVAVGPAHATAPTSDITTPENPLFCEQVRKKLPGVNQEDNLETEGEKIP